MSKEEIFNILYGKEKIEVYSKFVEIENSINTSNMLYQYFDEIKKLLLEEKSYLKLRGFRIICKLSKWDIDNKINNNIDLLLDVLNDDLPTIVRGCLKSMDTLLLYKIELRDKIINKIKRIDCSKYKDTMGPLIAKDINNILNSYK